MNRRHLNLIAATILFALTSPVLAQLAEHVPDEIIVKFKAGVPDSVIDRINLSQGTSVRRYSRSGQFHVLKIPQGAAVSQMVDVYSRNPKVDYAEANYIAHAHTFPNDPCYVNNYQWHLDNDEYGGINVEAAWEFADGTDVIVAVLDTGVAYEDYQEEVYRGNSGKPHLVEYGLAPDLAGTLFVPGYDFVNDDEHPNDDQGHGTHVTGTIAQTTNNGYGCAGVAYMASIMPVKVLNKQGWGTYDDIADGIRFAADNGADIINMSLGGSGESDSLRDAVIYADTQGVVIVCSSGNDGRDTVSYPARYEETIAVGATRYDETVTDYSNRGTDLDLTAPGGDTSVDQNGDEYGDGVLQQTLGRGPLEWEFAFYQGTSMAAPHVSGVAALVKSVNSTLTAIDVRTILETTAEDKGADGRDSEYGWGIVDAAAAVIEASNCGL